MTAEAITAALLEGLDVGPIALEELPQGTDYPALVYQVVSHNTMDYMCNHGKNQTARIQINPLAETVGKVNEIHELVKTALVSFSPRTVAGKRLVSCVFLSYGPITKDMRGIWTKPADYRIVFE
jgi:hypothetical protein